MAARQEVVFLLLAAMAVGGLAQVTLPPLPFAYEALEPVIDTQTNHYHHDTHHAAYVNNLNGVIARYNTSYLKGASLSSIVRSVGNGKLKRSGLPSDQQTLVHNNAGGAWNHNLWWRTLAPVNSTNTTLPDASTPLGAAIARDFGNATALVAALAKSAKGHFGSGWAWLVVKSSTGTLSVTDTLNQDNSLMVNKNGFFMVPILGIDVWEHSYYLKYGPGKATFVDSWFKVVNWRQVEANYVAAYAKSPSWEVLVGA